MVQGLSRFLQPISNIHCGSKVPASLSNPYGSKVPAPLLNSYDSKVPAPLSNPYEFLTLFFLLLFMAVSQLLSRSPFLDLVPRSQVLLMKEKEMRRAVCIRCAV